MRRLIALLVALVASLALTACGGDTSTTESAGTSSSEFNDADVTFATDMIPHHAQALSMVDLTVGNTISPGLQALVDDIRMAQTPEIEKMAAWLEKWGKPVPATARDHAHHDMDSMDDMDMPGMASMADMSALEAADGKQFEQRFLTMMIAHHQGAIEMAGTEVAEGQSAAAKSLARGIIDGQQRETDTMQQLLDR